MTGRELVEKLQALGPVALEAHVEVIGEVNVHMGEMQTRDWLGGTPCLVTYERGEVMIELEDEP